MSVNVNSNLKTMITKTTFTRKPYTIFTDQEQVNIQISVMRQAVKEWRQFYLIIVCYQTNYFECDVIVTVTVKRLDNGEKE